MHTRTKCSSLPCSYVGHRYWLFYVIQNPLSSLLYLAMPRETDGFTEQPTLWLPDGCEQWRTLAGDLGRAWSWGIYSATLLKLQLLPTSYFYLHLCFSVPVSPSLCFNNCPHLFFFFPHLLIPFLMCVFRFLLIYHWMKFWSTECCQQYHSLLLLHLLAHPNTSLKGSLLPVLWI